MTQITRTLGLTALLLMPALQVAAQEPAAAPAEPPTPVAPPQLPPPGPSGSAASFGAQGQIAVSADLPFLNEGPELAIFHESVSMGGGSTTVVGIQPSLDYFVAPNVSVGAQVGIVHVSANAGGGASDTEIGVEARAGYNIGLTDSVSLWPRLGIGYNHDSTSFNGSGTPDQSGYNVTLYLSVPVLWHPGSHFFLGAGPAFSTQLLNKIEGNDQGKTTIIGLTALIGGYFGGT
jgi:hypothetical protein